VMACDRGSALPPGGVGLTAVKGNGYLRPWHGLDSRRPPV